MNTKELEGVKNAGRNDWDLIKEIQKDKSIVETKLSKKEKHHWDNIYQTKEIRESNVHLENNHKKSSKSIHVNDTYSKSLRECEAQKIYEYVQTVHHGKFAINFFEIDQYLNRFQYFSKYSIEVRQKLLEFGILKIY